MILQEIINIIESAAPKEWQEAWDNSGLQVGNRNAKIHRALLTVDVTESVVDEAIRRNCNLIISHHPLLFHGLKTISGQTPQERCVEQLIRHGIALYSAHTTMDSWSLGVSGRMAQKLGIIDTDILVPASANDSSHGFGVIGNIPCSLDVSAFLNHVKNTFSAPILRFAGERKQIRRVALCGGAGAEFIDEAIRQHADVYITADLKYHEMAEASEYILLVDLDHWISEHFTVEIFDELLRNHIETLYSQNDGTPIKIFM